MADFEEETIPNTENNEEETSFGQSNSFDNSGSFENRSNSFDNAESFEQTNNTGKTFFYWDWLSYFTSE